MNELKTNKHTVLPPFAPFVPVSTTAQSRRSEIPWRPA